MSARPTLHLSGAALALAVLAGCGVAQDAAEGARDAAVDRASTAASQAVADAVQDQICAVVGDGQVSEADLDQLRSAVDQASSAGVPAEVLDPARDLLERGDAANQSLADLQERCSAR